MVPTLRAKDGDLFSMVEQAVHLLPIPGILAAIFWNVELMLSGKVPTLVLKRSSACCQTRLPFRSLSVSKDGNSACENASLDSLGSKEGR